MITGKCLYSIRKPVQEVLDETPDGKIALFTLICAYDEQYLGESVYIHRGKVFAFIDDQEIERVTGEDLRFNQYVDR